MIALLSAVALAGEFVELSPGVQYQGGQRVGQAEMGLSFELPQGWIGGIPPQSELMVLGSMTEPGMVIVMGDSGLDDGAMKAFLSQPLPLDMMTVAQPTGSPTAAGRIYTQSYQAQTLAGPMVGHARAYLSAAGAGVAFVALGPPEQDARYQELVAGLIGTIQEHEASSAWSEPAAGGTPAGAPAVSAPAGALAKALGGEMLLYMKTENGFSDKHQIFLCSDGKAWWTSNPSAFSGGVSGTLSYVGQDEDRGSWSVQGDRVVARWQDGSASSLTVQLRPDGSVDVIESNWWVQPQDHCP